MGLWLRSDLSVGKARIFTHTTHSGMVRSQFLGLRPVPVSGKWTGVAKWKETNPFYLHPNEDVKPDPLRCELSALTTVWVHRRACVCVCVCRMAWCVWFRRIRGMTVLLLTDAAAVKIWWKMDQEIKQFRIPLLVHILSGAIALALPSPATLC